MHVSTLSELRRQVNQYFGSKATYHGTVRHDPERDREDGFVRFLLYDSLVFGFGFSGAPYTSIGIFHQCSESVSTTSLLGVDFTFVENNEESLTRAFDLVDRFCRLRLPDKYLDVFDAR